jgi:eukaryotic-like serine/threonine-protein kinase
MKDHVTLLRPDRRVADTGGLSSLPPDLLEQVRGRVRLLALLLLIAFGLDPLIYLSRLVLTAVLDLTPDADLATGGPFQVINLGAVVVSAGLWWVARSDRVTPSRLHTLGLAYQITICFVIATASSWQYFIQQGTLPNLTWVPVVVILFPLIMPGPPARMLAAAIAAAATWPLALLLLGWSGRVTVNADAITQATFSGALAVVFAYIGARVVYGLGREVVTARRMGSYHLEELLGQGGMGEVWRATHRLLARPAAIKLISPSLRGDTQIRGDLLLRFEREAQAIAQLRSPHTVELFDFGVADDGTLYYAMELLDGIDADTLVRRFGPMPPERVIDVLRQICHSLDEADSHGLVHRDIKPANIFLCRYGREYDFVKVLDFGLVKALHDGRDNTAGLTRETAVHGTPAYIAPEQAMGSSDIDGRADIYATGCVAYWLLTGQLVFHAETPQGLLVQHATALPTPPSTRTDLPIPEALDRLVLHCLAKDPAQRPQTARELARHLAALDVSPWTEERARDWWQANLPLAE